MVRDAGHEIGLHGYSHENPKEMTIEQQRAVLDKSYRLITDFCGKVSFLRSKEYSKFSLIRFIAASSRVCRTLVGDAERGS